MEVYILTGLKVNGQGAQKMVSYFFMYLNEFASDLNNSFTLVSILSNKWFPSKNRINRTIPSCSKVNPHLTILPKIIVVAKSNKTKNIREFEKIYFY
jgi:hypothetical protein